MSTYLDDSHLAEIGEEYERFVGAYFEKFHSCMVIYQGRILGKQDGGIDLIAVAKDKTYLIQCKNYLPSKLLHENVVNQLSGAAKVFSAKYPSARNVTPTLVYTCQVDDSALYSAHINGITLKRLDYQKKTVDDRLVLFNSDFSTEGYAPISAGLNMLPDYDVRLKAVLDVVQEHQSEPDKEIVLPSGPVFRDQEKESPVTEQNYQRSSSSSCVEGKYYVRSETPLRFHYFSLYALAPYSLFQLIASVFQTLNATSGGFDLANGSILLMDIVTLASIAVFMAGGSRFTRYSYVAVFSWRYLNALVVSLLTIACLATNTPLTQLEIMDCLVRLGGLAVIGVYYHKRKALFYPELIPYEVAKALNIESVLDSSLAGRKTNHVAKMIICFTAVVLSIFIAIAGSVWRDVVESQSPSVTPKITATAKPTVKPTATPKPLSRPSNGHYKGFWYTTTGKQHWDGQLNVNTPDDGMYYCLIFVDADNPSNKCFSVFVWPDSEISIDVPTVDNLLLYTVCGKEWYGYEEYFGKNSIWSTSDDIFDFDTYIHTLTFEKVEDGNWETEDIKPYEVPFLD